jgi:hypothetical protein
MTLPEKLALLKSAVPVLVRLREESVSVNTLAILAVVAVSVSIMAVVILATVVVTVPNTAVTASSRLVTRDPNVPLFADTVSRDRVVPESISVNHTGVSLPDRIAISPVAVARLISVLAILPESISKLETTMPESVCISPSVIAILPESVSTVPERAFCARVSVK